MSHIQYLYLLSIALMLVMIISCTDNEQPSTTQANTQNTDVSAPTPVAPDTHLTTQSPTQTANDEAAPRQMEIESSQGTRTVKFAQFNVSFAHDGDPTEHFEQWITFMGLSPKQQQDLINGWREGELNEQDHQLAERVIQIRNIAAIIQHNQPDVLLLNEFNNDGSGKDVRALQGFQDNYLSVPQSLNSIDGDDMQPPIYYPFRQSYATNTGLPSKMDLHNNGYQPDDPNDAFGFGFYHGHYAFALLSKFTIDQQNTRTFQTFKRKDLPGAVMPTITVCESETPLPNNMACGDNWFTEEEWQQLRLSSKNHVDAPIMIPSVHGEKVIHVLLSHPTPPAFDTFSDNNKYRNSEENLFWLHYIGNQTVLYDDKGIQGGLEGDYFVLMGDLNADAHVNTGIDPRFNGIAQLMSDKRVNQGVSQVNGKFVPSSAGGLSEPNRRQHPFPHTRTATFGTRADYSVPSANLQVLDSGVYWAIAGEPGRLLFNDPRVGSRGGDKQVSSDHRLVWVTVKVD